MTKHLSLVNKWWREKTCYNHSRKSLTYFTVVVQPYTPHDGENRTFYNSENHAGSASDKADTFMATETLYQKHIHINNWAAGK